METKKSAAVRYTLLAICIAFIAGLLFAPRAEAQQLRVATGSPKGTYTQMFNEINSLCAESIPMIATNTSGSMENVNLLTGNKVNAGFVQTDVLYFRGRTEDLGNVKTLLALHPEEIHVLAPAVSPLKEGGYAGFGAKPVVFSRVEDLAGRRVGAAGGSTITAQVIRLQSEIAFQVVEFKSNDELLAALQRGDVEAGVMVGGAPLSLVDGLGPSWKLLPFSEQTMTKLKGVYNPARLNYPNMRSMGVPTISTDALFVTREYKTPAMSNGLARLRACVFSKLDELKETTGTHPKWQAVNSANKGKWSWYEFASPAK